MRRGVFSNRPRTTFTEEVMKTEKPKPDPRQYQFNNLDKKTQRERPYNYRIRGNYTQ